jgi:hypothetical protein
VLFYGVLAAFLVSRFYDRRFRAAVVIGAIVAVALVGHSRIYLGAHYMAGAMPVRRSPPRAPKDGNKRG